MPDNDKRPPLRSRIKLGVAKWVQFEVQGRAAESPLILLVLTVAIVSVAACVIVWLIYE